MVFGAYRLEDADVAAYVDRFWRRRRTKVPEERTRNSRALAVGIWGFRGTWWRWRRTGWWFQSLGFGPCPCVFCRKLRLSLVDLWWGE